MNQVLLSEAEWRSMRWPERLDYMQKKRNCETLKDLVASLFGTSVAYSTVRAWKSGSKTPGRKIQERLKKLFVDTGHKEDIDSACSCLIRDAAIDAADTLIRDVLISRNIRQLSIVLHSIASKLADSLVNAYGKHLVCSTESVYGRYPAREILKVELANHKNVRAIVEITHQENAVEEFTMTMSLHKGDAKYSSTTVAVNDYGIGFVSLSIQRFFYKSSFVK